MSAKIYTVRQLSQMAGVSVRTLHHYDHIGLLQPSARTTAGYRLYDERDLLRLQQALLFREMDFPLEEIRRILSDPRFDQVEALVSHRRMLQQRRERLEQLIQTVDKTIIKLTEAEMTLTDKELYEGFPKEQAADYQREARVKYGAEIVEESHRRLRRLTKEQWEAVKQEGGEITVAILSLMDRDPGDAQVQAGVARHYAYLRNFYEPHEELYRGLAQLYVEHDGFRAFYEKVRSGGAEFMSAAMIYYCDHTLKR